MEDRQGFIWVGTANGMLDCLDPVSNRFEHFQLETGNAVSQLKIRIDSLIQTRDGMIWVGTSYGLFRLNPRSGEMERFQNDPLDNRSLSDDYILSVYEDPNGILWIGTYGGGLNRFDRTSQAFQKFTQKDGLANDTVYGILEDDEHFLWVSTNHGLSKFSAANGTFENFDVQDGLQSNEFNGQAYFKSSGGELFFGGVNGVTAFHPQYIQDNPYLPPVVLSSFTVGGETVTTDQAIEYLETVELKWPQNYFEFSFSALSYQQPSENQYAYYLRGFDKEWNLNEHLRFGRYTNLPGGNFDLILVAANENAVWNLEGRTIHIIINPPFWERPLFQWGLIALIGILLGGGYYLKIHSVQRRNAELSEMVEERTAEIEQKRQVAEGLKGVLGLLNSNQPLQESLNFIVSSANRLSNADQVLLLSIKEDPITCVVVKGLQTRICADRCFDIDFDNDPKLLNWLAELAKTGAEYSINNLNTFLQERNQNQLLGQFPFRSMLMIPILSGLELFGSFIMLYCEEEYFTDEQIELASSFADQAALAIGNAKLRENAEQMAVADERNRLARDLHDAVTQTLFSASLIAEALPSLLENDPIEGQRMLKEMRQLSRGALAEMRTLLIELRPSAIIESKLPELLRQLAEAACGKTGAKLIFTSQFSQVLPEDIHIGFYRIAQEGLNNVVKHAHAKQVEILLESHTIKEDYITVGMEIRDDGLGFVLDEVLADHFGIRIMKERANLIQAGLTIESAPGQGTLINLEWQGRAGRNGA
jgi:signal transduction histidine kinase